MSIKEVGKILGGFNVDSVVQFEGTIYEKGYGLIARTVMRDITLHPKSKAIYAYICSFASNKTNGDRVAFPSVSLQCNELGMSEDIYFKYRKPLTQKGYIRIDKVRNEQGKFQRNLYTICAVPANDEEPYPKYQEKVNPNTENPYSENPSPDNVSTKNNRSKNNSYIINNLENNNFKNNINIKELDLKQVSKKNVEEELFGDLLQKLKLPFQVIRLIWDYNLQGYGNDQVPPIYDSLDLLELENFYNTNAYILSTATKRDVDYINDHEFYQIVKSIIQNVRPVKTTMGILKDFTLNKLVYKQQDLYEPNGFDAVNLPHNWLEE
jgi:hypothetical protein